jgi:hypothetical protein
MRRIPTLQPLSLALIFGLTAFSPSPGNAGDGAISPKLSGTIAFEVQNDLAFSSDDTSEEFNNLFMKIESALTLALTDAVSINTGLVLEQVQEPPIKGEDRTFADQGLFVEVLTLDYETGPVHLSSGKMGVNFGKAWDATPGVFGTDLAEEYEIAEAISVLGALRHDFGDGRKHTLTAQTFFLDTSGLAESALTRRRKTREGDGGLGNTGDFSSIALALDGGDFPALPGFAYHAAYVHHANDTENADNERRFALGGSYEFKIGDITVQPLAEYILLSDAEGTADQDRTYVTAALGLTMGTGTPGSIPMSSAPC